MKKKKKKFEANTTRKITHTELGTQNKKHKTTITTEKRRRKKKEKNNELSTKNCVCVRIRSIWLKESREKKNHLPQFKISDVEHVQHFYGIVLPKSEKKMHRKTESWHISLKTSLCDLLIEFRPVFKPFARTICCQFVFIFSVPYFVFGIFVEIVVVALLLLLLFSLNANDMNETNEKKNAFWTLFKERNRTKKIEIDNEMKPCNCPEIVRYEKRSCQCNERLHTIYWPRILMEWINKKERILIWYACLMKLHAFARTAQLLAPLCRFPFSHIIDKLKAKLNEKKINK